MLKRRGGLAVVVVVALGITCALPARARAHELLTSAREQAESAEFEKALLTLARAESEAVLTRSDVIELYLQRALIHFALRVPAAMARDLEMVATLEPELVLDGRIPPDVREAFPTHAEPLSLEVHVAAEPGHVRLQLQTRGLRPDLVRAVKMSGRAAGGEWHSGTEHELVLEAEPGQTVEYYAIAYGPGSAELATLGSWAEPEQLTPAPPAALENSAVPAAVWWVAGGVAVAAIATTVVLLTMADERTQLGPPEVRP